MKGMIFGITKPSVNMALVINQWDFYRAEALVIAFCPSFTGGDDRLNQEFAMQFSQAILESAIKEHSISCIFSPNRKGRDRCDQSWGA